MLRGKRLARPRWWVDLQRDMRVFAHLFPWWVAVSLLVGLIVATYLFWMAHRQWQGEPISLIKALFAVINMTFFQLTFADMPADERLDIFPIIIPLLGLPLLSLFGLKMINVIRVFFVRGERGQDWQETLVKSTIRNHILICGLGRIGYRVARTFALDHDRPLVGINNVLSPLVAKLLAAGVPVILGAAEHEEVLKKAGVETARVVVVCTDNDLVNLETAVRVRKLNPRARIVLRLFEDELIEDIKTHFKVEAVISRSGVAAMSFTYAAIGGEIVETFELADRDYVLAQVPLGPSSPVLGRTIGDVAREKDVTVVGHNCGSVLTVEPTPHTRLSAGDTLFVFTTMEQMISLVEYGVKHQPALVSHRKGPILVCGLGHTGYRVATNLLNLGCQVVGLDFEAGQLSQRLSELGVTLKFGDLRWRPLLRGAGVTEATAIVACTEDDMTNLQIALRARALNPNIRVVLRIFDDQLSQELRYVFGTNAVYSTSALASPDFVSAALDRMHVRFVDIGDQTQAIVRLQITRSALYNIPMSELQQEQNLTVLLHTHDGQVNIPPDPESRLSVGDEVLVLVTEDKLGELNSRNKTLLELQAEG